MRSEDYGEAAKRGVVVLAVMRIGTRLLAVVQVILFSVTLGVENTGLVGVALTTLVTIEVLSQLGVTKALIQRQGDNKHYFPTAFIAQAVRGVVIAMIIYFSAPIIVLWFNAPEAEPLLRWFAVIPLCRGIVNIAVIEFERKLEFRKVVILDVGSPIVDFVITIVCLLIKPDLYSLVWGKIAGSIWAVVISYLVDTCKWRIGWSWSRFLELHRFGRWIFLNGVIGLVLTRGSDFAVGRWLTISDLGVLTLSSMIAIMPMMELNSVINRVALPAYSRIQKDLSRLRNVFLRTFMAVSTIVVALMLIIILSIKDLVQLFFDASWQQMEMIVPFLAIWGACRALGAATSSVFMAVGKPGYSSLYHLVMLLMMVVFIYPAIKLAGLIGVSIMLATVGLIVQTMRYRLIAKILNCSAYHIYMRALVPFFIAGVCWSIVMVLRGSVQRDLPPQLTIMSTPTIGLILYLIGLLIWQRVSGIPVFLNLISLMPTSLKRPGS